MPKEKQRNEGEQLTLGRRSVTAEREGYVEGLFEELEEQLDRYVEFSKQIQKIQAQIGIAEGTIQAIRGYIYTQFSNTEEDVPANWEMLLKQARFVGARLGDACVEILKEQNELSKAEMLDELNEGQYRFRTPHPLREINAALLRHPKIRKEGDMWIYSELVSSVEVA